MLNIAYTVEHLASTGAMTGQPSDGKPPEPQDGLDQPDPAQDRLREVVTAPEAIANPDLDDAPEQSDAVPQDSRPEPASSTVQAEAPPQDASADPAESSKWTGLQEASDQVDTSSTATSSTATTGPHIPHSIEAEPEQASRPARKSMARRPIVVAAAVLFGISLSLAGAHWFAKQDPVDQPSPTPPAVTEQAPQDSLKSGGLLDMGEDLLRAEIEPDTDKDEVSPPDSAPDQVDERVILDVDAEWQPIIAPDRAEIAEWMHAQAAQAESNSDKIRSIGELALAQLTLDAPERDQYLDAVVKRMGFDPDYELWVTNPDTVDATVDAVETYTRAQTAISAILMAVEAHPEMQSSDDLHYMMAKAAIESNFVYRAPAQGSTGKGLFQFIDSTWLTEFHHHGAKYGYGDLADQIDLVGGKPVIEDEGVKQQILDLRSHPLVNALIAVDYTLSNDAFLRKRLPDNHKIGHAERYLAHWLGTRGGADFMEQYLSRPSHAAADYFVSVSKVRGNRSMFFFKGGGKRSFAQVHARAESKITSAINQLARSQTAYVEHMTSEAGPQQDDQPEQPETTAKLDTAPAIIIPTGPMNG
ncbi:MAG: hypothetical protein Alpg2KO_05300 [Alphaproteobacteria bacterium]